MALNPARCELLAGPNTLQLTLMFPPWAGQWGSGPGLRCVALQHLKPPCSDEEPGRAGEAPWPPFVAPVRVQ